VEYIKNILSLRDLDISNNKIESISQLACLVELETLDVSNNRVGDWSQIVSQRVKIYFSSSSKLLAPFFKFQGMSDKMQRAN
jgi:Leucine-rich repeat (LRR) protein